MLLLFTIVTACIQDLEMSSLYENQSDEIENIEKNDFQDPLIIDWNIIEDTWFAKNDELPSTEENFQAYDLLLQVYTEDFRPRYMQYQSKDEILTLEVEYLFGVVLRSMNKRHRLPQKSRKKQLKKLKIKVQTLIES
jgi:hypothetical protein